MAAAWRLWDETSVYMRDWFFNAGIIGFLQIVNDGKISKIFQASILARTILSLKVMFSITLTKLS
jgi:hypothetical protein